MYEKRTTSAPHNPVHIMARYIQYMMLRNQKKSS